MLEHIEFWLFGDCEKWKEHIVFKHRGNTYKSSLARDTTSISSCLELYYYLIVYCYRSKHEHFQAV